MSLASRVLNVVAIPGDVFADVKAGPASTANWLVPTLLLILTSWVAAWLIFSQESVKQQIREMTDKALQKQVEQGKLTEAQADQARNVAGISAQVGAYAGPVFAAVVSPFFWGLIVWGVGTRKFKGHFPYMKAVEVCGLANVIGILDVAVRTLLVIGLANPLASPSLSLLSQNPDPQSRTYALLGLVNVMTFWVLAVRAIGLARLAEVSFARAAVWVLGAWAAIMTLLFGISFGLQAAFGGK